MKTNKILVSILVIILVMSLGLTFSRNISAGAIIMGEPMNSSSTNKGVINVSGKAEIAINPDIYTFTIGVNTKNKDSKVAQKENTEIMDRVMKDLKESDIKDGDIETLSYNVYPDMQYDKVIQRSKVIGYNVSNSIEVKGYNIKEVGEVIDKVVNAGATNIGQIAFDISNREEIYLKALSLATKDSETKALSIAKTLGKQKVNADIISETKGYNDYPVLSKGVNMDSMESVSSTPISMETISIKAEISATYSY